MEPTKLPEVELRLINVKNQKNQNLTSYHFVPAYRFLGTVSVE